MAARKINLTKLLHTINTNAVRGHSYENFLHDNLSYESFFAQKFPDLRYYRMIYRLTHTLYRQTIRSSLGSGQYAILRL